MYHSNGTISHSIKYKNGLRHGWAAFYKSDGVANKKVKYKKGAVVFTYLYINEETTKTINRKGVERTRHNCNCGK